MVFSSGLGLDAWAQSAAAGQQRRPAWTTTTSSTPKGVVDQSWSGSGAGRVQVGPGVFVSREEAARLGAERGDSDN
ncbi:MAG: hypothetical protein A3H72_01415 [Candidatus Doudnabacteria bacterium RIFCSPLOWO2_02_FULL_48_8]|uniref:Uncharacterized protein n=1 Tax=Candidatus Doudnabacteria bacterium RIFCSPHIGHO2_01_FULL_46_24 TaxID=1817825 RepID=A0A1F5NTU8_9BACT|nr:MAG: hypothetical protein A2720_00935 [Candidatus Doudnabacteria bacterium RIFCSPHIGHO2_01_FULL_46_24]OGE95408.1 MAG: hypothetical protein A3H72_01415 [Candidatus Doudnabacteria bacterium RIFCSPLOWO2_02_FULL_48_8]OGE95459.1 MAG: hypothetical protein A3E98_01015 [Candidatus Doudnabacteria bacterium RIFCSPHIGHO2_12_FULL_48_11]